MPWRWCIGCIRIKDPGLGVVPDEVSQPAGIPATVNTKCLFGISAAFLPLDHSVFSFLAAEEMLITQLTPEHSRMTYSDKSVLATPAASPQDQYTSLYSSAAFWKVSISSVHLLHHFVISGPLLPSCSAPSTARDKHFHLLHASRVTLEQVCDLHRSMMLR